MRCLAHRHLYRYAVQGFKIKFYIPCGYVTKYIAVPLKPMVSSRKRIIFWWFIGYLILTHTHMWFHVTKESKVSGQGEDWPALSISSSQQLITS